MGIADQGAAKVILLDQALPIRTRSETGEEDLARRADVEAQHDVGEQ